MKTLIISFTTSVAVLVAASCAAPKMYLSFSDWDTDHTGSIERQEFVRGYTDQDYFDKWSPDKGSIGYAEMQKRLFMSLDRDKDLKLDRAEFNDKIDRFYFGLFHDQFDGWDDSHDDSICQQEFKKHVSASNLSSVWDANGDKEISEQEMAGGMFYVCDFNGDTRIANIEFEKWRVNR